MDLESIIRSKFSEAFEELLKTSPLEMITVKDIISKAGLSRSTFYKYFRDKYDLAFWSLGEAIFHNVENSRNNAEGEGLNLQSASEPMFRFIYDNQETYRKLLSYEGQNSFGDYYIESCIRRNREYARQAERDFSAEDLYSVIYHAAGTVEFIRYWLNNDRGLTSEEIYRIWRKSAFEKDSLIRILYE